MPLSAFARVICYATFVAGIAVLGATLAVRVASPWPLEWMEGASLQHAVRLLHGQPIYAAPTAEFIPFVYPPLAYVPMAAGVWLFGAQLWVGRLVSILALAGSLACVFLIVRRRTGFAAVGCWAAGVYALGFGYTGAFSDLVRVDSLFMLLVLLGIERLSARAFASGLIWIVLSCFAKQHGLIFLAAVGVGLLVSEGRAVASQLMAAAGALIAGVAALQAASAGWFLTYTWSVPAGHGLIPQLLLSYLGVDVLVYLPVLAAFVVLAARSQRSALDWALLAAGLLASALGRAHPGGDDNVRMPGFAVLVLAAAQAFPILWTAARTKRAHSLCNLGLALQPLLLVQLPAAHAPPPNTAERFTALETALRTCAGGDLPHAVALDHALLTGRAFLHTMALSDIRSGRDPKLTAAATGALLDALRTSDAPPSLAVSTAFPELMQVLREDYEPCSTIPALRLATGYELNATTIYRRKAEHSR